MYLRKEQVVGDLNMQMRTPNSKKEGSSLVLLSNGSLKPFTLLFPNPMNKDEQQSREDEDEVEVVRGTFECRACNKVFYSHQALGGHRASHKKIKGCFAAAFFNSPSINNPNYDVLGGKNKNNINNNNNNNDMGMIKKKKSKSHECSICHRVFPSGQALGGHKRCHWLPTRSHDTPPYIYTSSRSGVSTAAPAAPHTTTTTTFHNFLDNDNSTSEQPLYKKTKFGTSYNFKPLDLNQLPTPFNEVIKAKGDVGMWPSVTTNCFGDRGGIRRRDINNSVFCQLYNNTLIHANSIRHKSIHLKDSNVDRLHSSWLQLGIGSTSTV